MSRFGAYNSDNDVSVPFIQADIGPPTSGTHVAQEIYVDEAGELWVCVAGGTPGTWSNPAGGKELAYAELASGTQDVTSVFPTMTDITGVTITFDAPEGRPYMVEAFAAVKAQSGAPMTWGMMIADASAGVHCYILGALPTANEFDVAIGKRRFSASSGSKTYKMQFHAGTGDTVRIDTISGLTPAFIRAWVL